MEINVGDVFEDEVGYKYRVVSRAKVWDVLVERDPPYSRSYVKDNRSCLLISRLSEMKRIPNG